MKKQKLRKYIKVVINEIFHEASRSVVKKGKKQKEEDREETEKSLNKMAGVDKDAVEKFKIADALGKKGGESGDLKKGVEPGESGIKPGSEEKTKDSYGRNITKYTTVSKKGRETPMIQYDDPDEEEGEKEEEGEECILKEFDWASVKIEGYHYEEDIKTDVIVYNNALIVQYKKESRSFSIPIKSLQKPDKTEEDDKIVITSTSRSEKIATCDDAFTKKICHIYTPLSTKEKLLEKWNSRDTTKTKDCDNVYDKTDQERFRLDKGEEEKEKKSMFRGDTKFNLKNLGPSTTKIPRFHKNI